MQLLTLKVSTIACRLLQCPCNAAASCRNSKGWSVKVKVDVSCWLIAVEFVESVEKFEAETFHTQPANLEPSKQNTRCK